MVRKSIEDLGTLQRAVMEVVWESGEATVNQVRDRLEQGKSVGYTTVLAAMQKLEKSGWLRHRAEGRTYVYQPTRTREQEGTHTVREFTRRVFRGEPLLLFERFIDDRDLSADDLAQLQEMIDSRQKEMRDD